MKRPLVAPSLLAADPLHFAEEVAAVETAGADWHHVDVMDGHFVPNLTFGPPLIQALKRSARLPLDVHIMVSNPDHVALDYVRAGASSLTFHVEATVHHHRLLEAIRSAGARPGIAINPGTPLESIYPLLEHLDLVNVMSVNPGFGGQSFIEQSVDRVRRIADELAKRHLTDRVLIEVDGGVNAETGALVVAAGASVLVAGAYVYGAKGRAARIGALQALNPARQAPRKA